MPVSPVILSDADNTLWDTDRVYAEAQLALLDAVDRFVGVDQRKDPLAYVRSFDQALAELDHRHLRYSPKLLVRALVVGNAGQNPQEAARRVVAQTTSILPETTEERITEVYLAAIRREPELLPGVVAGLEMAFAAGIDVWILSEGAAQRQRDRTQRLGICHLIRGVSECTKTFEQFTRQRLRFSPAQVYVVGDQPDRDIIPAQAAGCTGVLVPSRFRPNWIAAAAWLEADFTADSFNDAVSWIVSTSTVPQARATG